MAYAAVPAPPASALRLASDDPDEVTSWVARQDGYHSRVVHGTGPYGFELARIRTPDIQVGWVSLRLANTLRASFRQPTFHLPITGTQQYSCGRRRVAAVPGTLVFVAHGTETTRCCDANRMMAIELDAAALERELASRHGRGPVDLQRAPRSLETTGLQRREVFDSLAALVNASADGDFAESVAHGEARVLNALAATLVDSAQSSSTRLAPRRLHALEDWIEAHLGEPITLGLLCEVARESERSLQIAFQSRRGMSPLRYVCERRLSAVQKHLINAGPDDNVTSIATRFGFTHLGRFSSLYAAGFGESPSRTLARGRGSRAVRTGTTIARNAATT